MPKIGQDPTPLPPCESKLRRGGRVAGKRREAILCAATRVFFEKGYEASSMDDIIADVGGSKATIYGYFRSKEKLFEEVIRYKVCWLSRLLFELPEETSKVETALTEFGEKLIVLILDDTAQALKRICVHEAEKFPELGRIFYESGAQIVVKRLTDFIQRAHRNGDLHAPDSDMAAWQFTALCQAKYVHPCVTMGRGKPSASQVKKAVDAAVQTFMAAFGRKETFPQKASRHGPAPGRKPRS